MKTVYILMNNSGSDAVCLVFRLPYFFVRKGILTPVLVPQRVSSLWLLLEKHHVPLVS